MGSSNCTFDIFVSKTKLLSVFSDLFDGMSSLAGSNKNVFAFNLSESLLGVGGMNSTSLYENSFFATFCELFKTV